MTSTSVIAIGHYELRCTCPACPEQYDVYRDSVQVAYLRLRHGRFRADVPQCGGDIVHTSTPKGDGRFEDDERDSHLHAAIAAIDRYYTAVATATPNNT